MPLPLSQADGAFLLKQFRKNDTTNIAYKVSEDRVIKTDVFIAGSGPIGYVPYSSLIGCWNPNSLLSMCLDAPMPALSLTRGLRRTLL